MVLKAYCLSYITSNKKGCGLQSDDYCLLKPSTRLCCTHEQHSTSMYTGLVNTIKFRQQNRSLTKSGEAQVKNKAKTLPGLSSICVAEHTSKQSLDSEFRCQIQIEIQIAGKQNIFSSMTLNAPLLDCCWDDCACARA